MKLTEGLGIVNNLIFFRSFFFKRLEIKCHKELFGFFYQFLGHISGWLEQSSWMDVNASKSGLLLPLSLFECQTQDGSLHWLLELFTWLVRSPKVHSKSSRLAEVGKQWKGVDLQFHFLPSSFFFSFLFLF